MKNVKKNMCIKMKYEIIIVLLKKAWLLPSMQNKNKKTKLIKITGELELLFFSSFCAKL